MLHQEQFSVYNLFGNHLMNISFFKFKTEILFESNLKYIKKLIIQNQHSLEVKIKSENSEIKFT